MVTTRNLLGFATGIYACLPSGLETEGADFGFRSLPFFPLSLHFLPKTLRVKISTLAFQTSEQRGNIERSRVGLFQALIVGMTRK